MDKTEEFVKSYLKRTGNTGALAAMNEKRRAEQQGYNESQSIADVRGMSFEEHVMQVKVIACDDKFLVFVGGAERVIHGACALYFAS